MDAGKRREVNVGWREREKSSVEKGERVTESNNDEGDIKVARRQREKENQSAWTSSAGATVNCTMEKLGYGERLSS